MVDGQSYVKKKQLRLDSEFSCGRHQTQRGGLACMMLLRNLIVLLALCGAATLDIPSHASQQPASSSKICRSWSMRSDAGLCSRNSESLDAPMGTMRLRGGGAKQLYHLTVIHPLPRLHAWAPRKFDVYDTHELFMCIHFSSVYLHMSLLSQAKKLFRGQPHATQKKCAHFQYQQTAFCW